MAHKLKHSHCVSPCTQSDKPATKFKKKAMYVLKVSPVKLTNDNMKKMVSESMPCHDTAH